MLLLLFWILPHAIQAQTLEWQKLFEPGKPGLGANAYPNSVVSSSGKITGIRNVDTLRLVQTDGNGNITATFDTQRPGKNYTALQLTPNQGVALVYGNESLLDSCRFLETDSLLNPIREFTIQVSPFQLFFVTQNLFRHNGNLYLSLVNNPNHQLMRIEPNNTLSTVYTGSSFGSGKEHLQVLENGNFLFSFETSAAHNLRCVSPVTGAVVWERATALESTYKLGFIVKSHENTVYCVGHQRSFPNGDAADFMNLTALDANTGNLLWQTQFIPAGNRAIEINDFVYNPIDDRLYLCYTGWYDQLAVTVARINPHNQQIVEQQGGLLQLDDQYGVPTTAKLHLRTDGSLILLYKSFKNDMEKGNLYISRLDTGMAATGSLEINLPRNSSEAVSDVQAYGHSKILVTGYLPHPDPGIKWDSVNHYTALVHVGNLLPLNLPSIPLPQLSIFPNPTAEVLNIRVSDDRLYDLTWMDAAGKVLYQKPRAVQQEYVFDLGGYAPGVYFLSLSNAAYTLHRRIVVNR